jgi:signal transduction histidine kinase/CheY-like chemotaxis protein
MMIFAFAMSLQFTGIRTFKGERTDWRIITIIVGSAFLLNVWFSIINPNPNARAISNSLFLAFGYAACAYALIFRTDPKLRIAHWFAGFPFVILMMFLLVRAAYIFLDPPGTYELLENVSINPVSFFISMIAQLSVTIGFILMLHYRLVAELREVAADAQVAHQETEVALHETELARHEAETANIAKSKFLAAVGHDLRQPIHAQGLFLAALSLTELNAGQQELLANTNAAAKSSVDILNALLDFSRIEAGVIKPELQSFRLQSLLNKIENEFGSLADEKGIVYRSRDTTLIVNSDPVLVELILRNLISNSIRYTAHGGILVTCRKRGGNVVIEVWDTGIGIAETQQQEVFREFLQLSNPERDRKNGLGLGLAIVQGLARTLQLDISLVSKLGRGSVFRLSLPVATQFIPETNSRFEHDMRQKINKRVLVIDDDEIVRVSMGMLLRKWGCECDIAESIEVALNLAHLQPPEIIISDYRLREHRTGLEAIGALRSLLGSNLPAILITGDTAPDRLKESLASGIPILHKPVSAEQLHRSLFALLS